jgi:RHS repeat-associated protein
MSSHQYNELGQLVEKNIHSTNGGSTFLQSNDYKYNIRGWLTHINNSALTNDGVFNNDADDLFGMELRYDQPLSINGTNTTSQYNGNISSIQWKTNNLATSSVSNAYGFQYDILNRLQSADFAAHNGTSYSTSVGMFNEGGLSYDRNGNILSLNRNKKFGGAMAQIDALAYTYSGNKLTNVHDNSAYYAATPTNPDVGFSEVTHATGLTEYDYDKNGNMVYDLNKGITSITYNHLNLPTVVTISGGKTIEYTYSATGTKLKYKAIDNGTVIKESDYIGGIQYEAGQLAFVMTGEGRALKRGTNWEYEYHLKDHLGNTRVAFGNLQDVVGYTATMETEKATTEEIEQNSTTGLKHVLDRRDGMFNHTLADKDSPAPSKSAWLNGAVGREVGPGKKLDVSNGDKLKMEVYVRYAAGSGNASDVVASLIGAVTTTFNITAGENLAAYNGMNSYLPGYTNGITYNSGQPKAYINYILFDANYTNSQYGYVAMPNAAVNGWQKLSLDVTVPMNGFAYVWVSNESNYNVYFDDLKIIHEKTTSSLKVVQRQDYYPFGLTFNSYQSENSFTNRYNFNGKETQSEFSLNWYDYGARMYLPDLGKWITNDPYACLFPSISTYAYSWNDPVNYIDKNGEIPIPIITGLIGAGGAAIYGLATGKNGKQILALAAGGFVAGATLGFGTAAVGLVGGASSLTTATFANSLAGASYLGAANMTYVSIGTGVTGGMLGEFVQQSIDVRTGEQDGYDKADIVLNGVFGLAASVLGPGIDRAKDAVKGTLKEEVAKSLTSTASFQSQKTTMTQLIQQLKQASAGLGSHGKGMTNREARIAAQKLINEAQRTGESIVRGTIIVTENGVEIIFSGANTATTEKLEETNN